MLNHSKPLRQRHGLSTAGFRIIHHERIWETVSEHEAIVAALNARDEARAAEAMAGHIRGLRDGLGLGWGRGELTGKVLEVAGAIRKYPCTVALII